MHAELADHICLIAAPIYAMLIARALATGAENIPAEVLSDLRKHAITQALALRLDALEMPSG